MFMPKKTIL
jgi:hypothetical protein